MATPQINGVLYYFIVCDVLTIIYDVFRVWNLRAEMTVYMPVD